MRSRSAFSPLLVAGQGRLVAAFALALAATGAVAGDSLALESSPATAAQADVPVAAVLAGLGRWQVSLAEAALPAEQADPSVAAEVPAHELAAGLDVQITQNRRQFRARALDWVRERSINAAEMADFLVGGGDSGWHLTVDPRGDDEYQLQWKARFR